MIPKATEMTDSKKPRMILIAISAPKFFAPHWAVVMIPQMRTWVALSGGVSASSTVARPQLCTACEKSHARGATRHTLRRSHAHIVVRRNLLHHHQRRDDRSNGYARQGLSCQ